MEHISYVGISELQAMKDQIHQLDTLQQKEQICKASPYSTDITAHIRLYGELQFYCALQLQESFLTRPTILREIDFALWISSENCTNLELMRKGNAPYAFDAPEGKIELHHIGQSYDAPFAELTQEEHNTNSRLLHHSAAPSWRSNQSLERAFYAEREVYWKRRAQQDYIISEKPFDTSVIVRIPKQQEYLTALRNLCEEIYNQCTIEDLDYLSDLAKSYAMMKRIGASTMGEFLSNVRDAKQAEIRCPFCRTSEYVLHGVYQAQGEKIQRYRCKKCNKVFTAYRRSLVSGSSFSYRDWIKFIDCLYNGYTLKQIAKACDISEKTAHENRIRLFYALKLLDDKVRLQGNIVLDETYLPVSFKGNHSGQEDFVMPRAANKRGGENHMRGITDNLVCIVCAVDDSGNSVATVAGTGNVSTAKLKYVLQDYLSENVICLFSDKSRAIKAFADTCGYKIKQEKLLRKGTRRAGGETFTRDAYIINRHLQIINSYHSRLKKFLDRFSGISTKYLSGYLYLFAWRERNKDRDPIEAYKELLAEMTEPNNYLPVSEIINDEHIPNALKINGLYRKRENEVSPRNKEIYRRYAAGETMTSIAADYGITKQSISLIINNMRKKGFAYKTDRDKLQEQEQSVTPLDNIPKESLDFVIRDYQIYAAKQAWEGSADAFNKAMAAKHGISEQTVKNVVAIVKRMHKLKEEVYIYENVSFRSMEEVYQNVYSDYLRLKLEKDGRPDIECAHILAEQYNFAFGNILRIIKLMQSDVSITYFDQKRKLTTTETYNRDKAVFIDYLRWTGDKKDFCTYAAKKYGLSYYYIYAILRFCLYADPTRYEIV